VHIVLVLPAASGAAVPTWAATAPTFRVLSANLYDANRSPAAAAALLAHADVDVLVLVEVSSSMHAALESAGIEEQFPYEIRNQFQYASVIDAIYSRIPLSDTQMVHLGDMWLPTARLDLGATSVRLLGVH